MQHYINQLLDDINYAEKNVSWPFAEKELALYDWMPDDEEDATAPVRSLQEWTGIKQEMLPPADRINTEQIHLLLKALKKMLDAYNCSFVLQTETPPAIQYAVIRENFNQQVKIKRWHMGFFEVCPAGTVHKECALGEYCQCAFYEEFFSNFKEEELTPEEERARALEIEVSHIKKKYGDDWMKYYPYHLDANYDDDEGNPHNYGFEKDGDDEDDNWWR